MQPHAERDHVASHFHANAAFRHMKKRVPTVRVHETAGGVRDLYLSKHGAWDMISYTYVVDAEQRLIGVASVKEICAAPADKKMSAFMRKHIVTAHPHTDLRAAAARAIAHGIKAVPVTDTDNVFLGVIDTDTILSTLEHEHVRDLLALSGVHAKNKTFADLTAARLGNLVKWRTPWLLVGLFGGMLMTGLVDAFKGELEKVIALAFFIPVIVYMGDAVGTQTQTIYVRSIALESINKLRYFLREIVVDACMGAVSAGVIMPFAYVITHDVSVTAIVGISMFLVMVVAGPVAIIIPELLMRFRRDPAVGGGPFTTVIQDLLSLLIYFSVASLLMLR